jgi:hypothetical protein
MSRPGIAAAGTLTREAARSEDWGIVRAGGRFGV